jgi:hypothetical protein
VVILAVTVVTIMAQTAQCDGLFSQPFEYWRKIEFFDGAPGLSADQDDGSEDALLLRTVTKDRDCLLAARSSEGECPVCKTVNPATRVVYLSPEHYGIACAQPVDQARQAAFVTTYGSAHTVSGCRDVMMMNPVCFWGEASSEEDVDEVD